MFDFGWFTRVESKLDLILSKLGAAVRQEMKMSQQLDDLKAKVTALTDVASGVKAVVDGSIVLLNDLKAKLDAAIAAGADVAQLQSLSDQVAAASASLASEKDALAAAVLANTPTP